MISTGRYSADRITAYALGKAANRPAPPRTSQVSLPSQIGAAVFIMWSNSPSVLAVGARMPSPSTTPSNSTYISTLKPTMPNQTTGSQVLVFMGRSLRQCRVRPPSKGGVPLF